LVWAENQPEAHNHQSGNYVLFLRKYGFHAGLLILPEPYRKAHFFTFSPFPIIMKKAQVMLAALTLSACLLGSCSGKTDTSASGTAVTPEANAKTDTTGNKMSGGTTGGAMSDGTTGTGTGNTTNSMSSGAGGPGNPGGNAGSGTGTSGGTTGPK